MSSPSIQARVEDILDEAGSGSGIRIGRRRRKPKRKETFTDRVKSLFGGGDAADYLEEDSDDSSLSLSGSESGSSGFYEGSEFYGSDDGSSSSSGNSGSVSENVDGYCSESSESSQSYESSSEESTEFDISVVRTGPIKVDEPPLLKKKKGGFMSALNKVMKSEKEQILQKAFSSSSESEMSNNEQSKSGCSEGILDDEVDESMLSEVLKSQRRDVILEDDIKGRSPPGGGDFFPSIFGERATHRPVTPTQETEKKMEPSKARSMDISIPLTPKRKRNSPDRKSNVEPSTVLLPHSPVVKGDKYEEEIASSTDSVDASMDSSAHELDGIQVSPGLLRFRVEEQISREMMAEDIDAMSVGIEVTEEVHPKLKKSPIQRLKNTFRRRKSKSRSPVKPQIQSLPTERKVAPVEPLLIPQIDMVDIEAKPVAALGSPAEDTAEPIEFDAMVEQAKKMEERLSPSVDQDRAIPNGLLSQSHEDAEVSLMDAFMSFVSGRTDGDANVRQEEKKEDDGSHHDRQQIPFNASFFENLATDDPEKNHQMDLGASSLAVRRIFDDPDTREDVTLRAREASPTLLKLDEEVISLNENQGQESTLADFARIVACSSPVPVDVKKTTKAVSNFEARFPALSKKLSTQVVNSANVSDRVVSPTTRSKMIKAQSLVFASQNTRRVQSAHEDRVGSPASRRISVRSLSPIASRHASPKLEYTLQEHEKVSTQPRENARSDGAGRKPGNLIKTKKLSFINGKLLKSSIRSLKNKSKVSHSSSKEPATPSPESPSTAKSSEADSVVGDVLPAPSDERQSYDAGKQEHIQSDWKASATSCPDNSTAWGEMLDDFVGYPKVDEVPSSPTFAQFTPSYDQAEDEKSHVDHAPLSPTTTKAVDVFSTQEELFGTSEKQKAIDDLKSRTQKTLSNKLSVPAVVKTKVKRSKDTQSESKARTLSKKLDSLTKATEKSFKSPSLFKRFATRAPVRADISKSESTDPLTPKPKLERRRSGLFANRRRSKSLDRKQHAPSSDGIKIYVVEDGQLKPTQRLDEENPPECYQMEKLVSSLPTSPIETPSRRPTKRFGLLRRKKSASDLLHASLSQPRASTLKVTVNTEDQKTDWADFTEFSRSTSYQSPRSAQRRRREERAALRQKLTSSRSALDDVMLLPKRSPGLEDRINSASEHLYSSTACM